MEWNWYGSQHRHQPSPSFRHGNRSECETSWEWDGTRARAPISNILTSRISHQCGRCHTIFHFSVWFLAKWAMTRLCLCVCVCEAASSLGVHHHQCHCWLPSIVLHCVSQFGCLRACVSSADPTPQRKGKQDVYITYLLRAPTPTQTQLHFSSSNVPRIVIER